MLNFIGYFVCGIPISKFLAFNYEMGIRGIWIGPSFAVAFLTLTYNLIIAKIDWKQLIEAIEERTRIENETKERLEKERSIKTEATTLE